MKEMKNNKILAIVGPTASGKSDLAVKLAKRFDGEIISADSRQVYKGLDIGTGKITKKEMRGIPHHLLDVVDPRKQFTAADFSKKAQQAITMIYHSAKIPIVVGGTGFYIDALVGTTSLPDVPPNKKLRKRLEKKTVGELYKILKKKDVRRAKSIDPHNKIRLIRALEIIEKLGKVPKIKKDVSSNFLYIGLKPDNLDEKIYKRLQKRMGGIIREVRKLHRESLSYKRMFELGLEYRYIGMYLQKKLTRKAVFDKLFIEIKRYAKRQMTWFKHNKKVKWFRPEEQQKIENYLKKRL